jgi:hypothetical protein
LVRVLSLCSFFSLHRTWLHLLFLHQDTTGNRQFCTTLPWHLVMGLPATEMNSSLASAALIPCLFPCLATSFPSSLQAVSSCCSQHTWVPFNDPWHLQCLFLAPVPGVQTPNIYFYLRKSYNIKHTFPLEKTPFKDPLFLLML